MRVRILIAILSVTGTALLLFGIPLAFVVQRLVGEDAMLRVERQAVLAARDVPGDFAISGDPVELPAGTDGVSLSLYDDAGHLVVGNGSRAAVGTTVKALGNQVSSDRVGGSRIVAVPVTADERVVGAIEAVQPTSQSDARARRYVALLAVLAIGVLAVGALIGHVVAGRLVGPWNRLRDVAVQLGHGDFSAQMEHSSIPEVDEAATAMAVTAQRLDDLVSRERAFSADASHQLRTPLAGLRSGLETELQFPRADRTEVLREALEDIGRLESTITELLTLARAPKLAPASCSLVSVLGQLADSWHGRFAAAGRPLLIADAADAPPLAANGVLLRHALDVLIDNALVHGTGETRVDYDVAAAAVTIAVADENPAPAANAPPQSASAADAGDGPAGDLHGLGLPLAARLIEAMPGRFNIVRQGERRRFEIVVGRFNPPSPAGSARA
ncbi:MAG: HAMP domain-containing sensor histidine kinase [Actinomycetota bacterium]